MRIARLIVAAALCASVALGDGYFWPAPGDGQMTAYAGGAVWGEADGDIPVVQETNLVFRIIGATNDISGNGNNLVYGTGLNAPAWDGQSIVFDGNDWADVGTSTTLFNADDSLSVSVWAKFDIEGVSTEAVMNHVGLTELILQRLNLGARWGVNGTFITSTGGAGINSWNYWTVTYDGSQIVGYINGAAYTTNSASGTLSVNQLFTLGTFDKSSQWFTGDLDMPTGWDVTLTAGEVATQYNAETGKNAH